MSLADDDESLARLARLVARLRAPDGCPWDREQRLTDLRAYLLEEAHEVAAAIDAGDWDDLRAELGDLLFQIAFISGLAAEGGRFSLADVARAIEAKMIARHPHVFGDETLADAQAVREAWERRKVAAAPASAGLLAGTPSSLPALVQSYRMSQKAAGVGFDWPDARAVLAKVDEELAEVRSEMERASARSVPRSDGHGGSHAPRAVASGPDALAAEIGDLLFAVANLARHLEVDPEAALAQANRKFRARFGHIERRLAESGRTVNDASLDEMEALWKEAKSPQRSPADAER